MDVTFGNLTNVVVYKQEYDSHQYSEHYRIGFRSPQGPSEWEVTVDGHGHVDSVSTLSITILASSHLKDHLNGRSLLMDMDM